MEDLDSLPFLLNLFTLKRSPFDSISLSVSFQFEQLSRTLALSQLIAAKFFSDSRRTKELLWLMASDCGNPLTFVCKLDDFNI
jgi:hypothetical protein